MSNKKIQIFYQSLEKINNLIEQYQNQMDSLKESMASNDIHTDYDQEGSGGQTLGDFERSAAHLDNARKMKQTLNQVDREHYSETIKFGSVVETDKNYYFIAVPLGKVHMDDGSAVQVISTDAPIFEKLKGKKKGDTFKLNDEEIEILNVQ
ncbi:transcription elongation factor [Antarcticibacterium sp. 1MA-6-2]|uniref:transcription elongation factor n=1 Tax=Antarcticibacterium sp. 1MA-6-2 TaxID=2908210 RepID=UPI001F3021BB|nr:transcription elongation factor [Antarcticibacterium sp. 1MA-6-2]UJH91780.1 transcription elongation factor [Antarcticibacterium sp. 1MA-6-2]